MKARNVYAFVFLAFWILLGVRVGRAEQKQLSVADIEFLLGKGVTSSRMQALIKEQGVSFDQVTEEIRARLRRAGADAEVIHAVERAAAEVVQKKGEEPRPVPDDKKPSTETVLLTRARKQEQEKKLISPPHDNALETYQEVLRVDSQNEEALAGIRRIVESYVQRAKVYEKKGEWDKARESCETARKIAYREDMFLAAIKKAGACIGRPIGPPGHPPQINQRFPLEEVLTMREGEKRTFLAAATDPDGDAITYRWSVNGAPVEKGEKFIFAADQKGQSRVLLEVIDQTGLRTGVRWTVQVEGEGLPPVVPPPPPPSPLLRLVMFTPYQDPVSLFLHQSRFFVVQVEVAGVAEPSLRYDWTVNGQSVPGKEIFEFKDQSIGKYTVMVTVTAPSGSPLTRRWTVVVRGVQERDDIGLLWWPRMEIFGTENIVTTADQPVLTLHGQVRNIDETRSADNVAVWVSSRDQSGKPLARHIAVPTPQPLAPDQVGDFTVLMPNITSAPDFHFELLSKSKEDEDPQRVKEQLLQRAEAAKRKKDWENAESFIIAAMKVYPPDEESVGHLLQDLRAAWAKAGGVRETNIEEPTRQYRIIASTPLLKKPVKDADVITVLSVNKTVNVIGIEGDYLEIQLTKENPPGYVSRKDATPMQ